MQSGRSRQTGADPLFRRRAAEKVTLPTPARQETPDGALRRRSFISTVFTATRYSHVEKAESPRNEPTLRNTCRNASCVRSSASASILRHQQTNGIHALLVQLEERGKSLLVAALCALNQAAFGFISVGFSSGSESAFVSVAEITQVATVVSFFPTKVLCVLSMIPGAFTF